MIEAREGSTASLDSLSSPSPSPPPANLPRARSNPPHSPSVPKDGVGSGSELSDLTDDEPETTSNTQGCNGDTAAPKRRGRKGKTSTIVPAEPWSWAMTKRVEESDPNDPPEDAQDPAEEEEEEEEDDDDASAGSPVEEEEEEEEEEDTGPAPSNVEEKEKWLRDQITFGTEQMAQPPAANDDDETDDDMSVDSEDEDEDDAPVPVEAALAPMAAAASIMGTTTIVDRQTDMDADEDEDEKADGEDDHLEGADADEGEDEIDLDQADRVAQNGADVDDADQEEGPDVEDEEPDADEKCEGLVEEPDRGNESAGEQGVEGGDELDADTDMRPEALDVLAAIELKFALLRERLYVEKMDALAWEETLIADGIHPELTHLQNELLKRRDKRIELATLRRTYETECVLRKRRHTETGIWSWWEHSRDELQTTMVAEANRKRRRIERERRALERPPPNRRIPLPPPPGPFVNPLPDLRKILDSSSMPAAMETDVKGKRRQTTASSYVTPSLALYTDPIRLTSAEVRGDLEVFYQASYASRCPPPTIGRGEFLPGRAEFSGGRPEFPGAREFGSRPTIVPDGFPSPVRERERERTVANASGQRRSDDSFASSRQRDRSAFGVVGIPGGREREQEAEREREREVLTSPGPSTNSKLNGLGHGDYARPGPNELPLPRNNVETQVAPGGGRMIVPGGSGGAMGMMLGLGAGNIGVGPGVASRIPGQNPSPPSDVVFNNMDTSLRPHWTWTEEEERVKAMNLEKEKKEREEQYEREKDAEYEKDVLRERETSSQLPQSRPQVTPHHHHHSRPHHHHIMHRHNHTASASSSVTASPTMPSRQSPTTIGRPPPSREPSFLGRDRSRVHELLDGPREREREFEMGQSKRGSLLKENEGRNSELHDLLNQGDGLGFIKDIYLPRPSSSMSGSGPEPGEILDNRHESLPRPTSVSGPGDRARPLNDRERPLAVPFVMPHNLANLSGGGSGLTPGDAPMKPAVATTARGSPVDGRLDPPLLPPPSALAGGERHRLTVASPSSPASGISRPSTAPPQQQQQQLSAFQQLPPSQQSGRNSPQLGGRSPKLGGSASPFMTSMNGMVHPPSGAVPFTSSKVMSVSELSGVTSPLAPAPLPSPQKTALPPLSGLSSRILSPTSPPSHVSRVLLAKTPPISNGIHSPPLPVLPSLVDEGSKAN
ncbi:hypothetical protein FISHEDRAFT_71376 [Fistulina hepatica ATCC 64428]|nr:hypothetical protein FISHEDRAFT_71376 [Fistulina hepatica ATCC 64428]